MAQKYISFTRTQRRLGVSADTMRRIAEHERLTMRRLPAVNRIDFLLEDIERIERESFSVAGQTTDSSSVMAG